MKKLIVLSLILLSSTIFAQKPDFEKANTDYSDGNYKMALKAYSSILKEGKTSAELYFNLGNVYYKLNKVPESIFYYEKALQLDPTDKDIQNNLKFANKRTIDAIETKNDTGLAKILNGIISSFDVNTWAWLAVIFAFAVGIFFLFYRFAARQIQQRLFFALTIISFVMSGAAVFFAFQQTGVRQSEKYAIVFNKEVEVRAEPNPGADLAFTLHEGTKVQILEDFNGYYKVELTDGQIGWLKTSAIKSLKRAKI